MKMQRLVVVAVAMGLAGCNELRVGSATKQAGQTFNLPVSLKLDAGVTAGGVENILDVQPPLILNSCTFLTSTTDPMSAAVRRMGEVKVITIAKDITAPWSGNSTSLYYCSFTIPANTAPGDYTVTPQSVGLSDERGHPLAVSQKGGTVHVVP